MYQHHMSLKLGKPILKYTFIKNNVISFASLNISNCQSAFKYMSLDGICLYLHDSYTTEFDFANYAFAKLVLVRLYIAYTQKPTLNPNPNISSGAWNKFLG